MGQGQLSAVACIDASVAVKWVLREDQTDLAMDLLTRLANEDTDIVVPPHFAAEVANAVYRRLQRGLMDLDDALERVGQIEAIPTRIVATLGLTSRAFTLGHSSGRAAIYDALYLALAEALACEFWTADAALFSAGQQLGISTRLLADFVPDPDGG